MDPEVTAEAGVLVVGAGPTGLALAGELALAGARPTVLESRTGPATESRALNLHPRTAELLDSRGLLEPLLEHEIVLGTPAHSFFGALPVPLDCAPWRTRYPHQIGVVQSRVEQRLRLRLAELGGSVLSGHQLTGLEQDDDGVTAVVSAPDGQRRIRARYLVGCDGGRSTVRKALGLPFPGSDGTELFVAADVVLRRPPQEWFDELDPERRRFLRLLPGNTLAGVVPSGDGGRLMFSLRGLEEGVHRLSFSDGSTGTADRDTPVTEEEILGAIRTACGADPGLKEVRWASRFSNACRQVPEYRTGRVLLAGDAAHIVVPLGGQGLNLGVQDAFNLGWKLAAVVRGHAPDALLDTYHAERHPVAAALLREARAQFALLDSGRGGADELAPLREILTELLRLPDTNRHLAGVVSGLGVRYDLPGAGHELLGARMPDVELGGTRLFELLRTGRGVLLDFGGLSGDASAWAGRVDLRRCAPPDGFGDLGAVLVRPDGHICWVGGADGPEESLHRWFGPSVR